MMRASWKWLDQTLRSLAESIQWMLTNAIALLSLLVLAFGRSLLLHLVLSGCVYLLWHYLLVPNTGFPELAFWQIFLGIFFFSLGLELVQTKLRS
ncbi:hypothetical protein [Leptolyngbya sp. FACHB-261]|uniref:hypothetical protein n=1 Tax=Leptolyngbya sp. FACHB-261 TaxID=2692806 RepID=UPI001689B3E8|nr:hypothetical protein [Leptolyngbya sp. FACHB-261]MBD2103232.1 hypothetical protein [Leptolyngbya sp. FACHB-261]